MRQLLLRTVSGPQGKAAEIRNFHNILAKSHTQTLLATPLQTSACITDANDDKNRTFELTEYDR
jgi:hypothetical protein